MQAPTLIAVLRGPELVVELANPPVCRVWGVRAELINRPLFDVLPECATGSIARCSRRRSEAASHWATRQRATLEREEGPPETVYLDFRVFAISGRSRRNEGVFVIANDITQQVLARLEVDDLREEAESANRAKDEFLAMLGHELRNPLSPILTALQLMKLRGDDASQRERTVIERQVTHLTRLVDDLLDVSRIARGKVELKEEIVELGEIVARAIEISSPLLEQRTHTLQVQCTEGAAVEGDPSV